MKTISRTRLRFGILICTIGIAILVILALQGATKEGSSSRLETSKSRSLHVVQSIAGELDEGFFGITMIPLGDLDGDKEPEWAVSSIRRAFTQHGPGQVDIMNGITGSRLFQLSGHPREEGYDGDSFGLSLAPVHSLTPDDGLCLAIGAPWFGHRLGRVDVYSLKNRKLVEQIFGEESDRLFGTQISCVPRLDSNANCGLLATTWKDRSISIINRTEKTRQAIRESTLVKNACSQNDIAQCSAFLAHVQSEKDCASTMFISRVGGVSGLDSSLLRLCISQTISAGSMSWVEQPDFTAARIGDLDGDNKSELLVFQQTAPFTFNLSADPEHESKSVRLNMVSGRTGNELFNVTVSGRVSSMWGGVDLNNDGAPDFVLIYGDPEGTRLGLFSGRSGQMLSELSTLDSEMFTSVILLERQGKARAGYIAVGQRTWNNGRGRVQVLEFR